MIKTFFSLILILLSCQLGAQNDYKPVTGNTLTQYKTQIKAKNLQEMHIVKIQPSCQIPPNAKQ